MRNQRDIVFHINANVLQNFHICISVSLNLFIKNVWDIPTEPLAVILDDSKRWMGFWSSFNVVH